MLRATLLELLFLSFCATFSLLRGRPPEFGASARCLASLPEDLSLSDFPTLFRSARTVTGKSGKAGEKAFSFDIL